jgi:hypothetical protein
MSKNKNRKKKSNGSKKQQQPEPQSLRGSSDAQAEYEMHTEEFTHSNTDKTCLDTKKPFVFKYFYLYNIWTGLSMLSPHEQAAMNLFGWVFAICMILYMFVFINGLRDGFNEAAAELQ